MNLSELSSVCYAILVKELYFPSIIISTTVNMTKAQNTKNESEFELQAAGSLKQGNYCMLRDHPCTVTKRLNIVHRKMAIGGVDIFTHQKEEVIVVPSTMMRVPWVIQTEMEVADVDEDGFVHAITEDGSLFETLRLPKEDQLIWEELWKLWEERGERNVLFTLLKAAGQQKWISGRYQQ